MNLIVYVQFDISSMNNFFQSRHQFMKINNRIFPETFLEIRLPRMFDRSDHQNGILRCCKNSRLFSL